MASILDQDFGSESEEGNFNPEPGADSDNEIESGPENQQSTSKNVNGTDERRQSAVDHKNGDAQGASGTKLHEGDIKDESEDRDGVGVVNRTGDDEDDEEDDEDDEDEDEEDAISVWAPMIMCAINADRTAETTTETS